MFAHAKRPELKPVRVAPAERAAQRVRRPELQASDAPSLHAPANTGADEREADEIGRRIAGELPAAGIGTGTLPDGVRAVAEKHLGVDLSGTTLRFDDEARTRARKLDAHAVTNGGTVRFARGPLPTTSSFNRNLLGHELTHVAQQKAHGLGEAASQCSKPIWKAGNVEVDPVAAGHIMTAGGLFSGQDQAHVTVSQRGKLAYDQSYTTPEDPFRWNRLKQIVDGARLKISAVSSGQKFDVLEGGQVTKTSLDEIKVKVGDTSVTGVTLQKGVSSPDPATDRIYYDAQSGVGALSHELFGHEWLALSGAPHVHPPAGSVAEKQFGTIGPQHGITDPFGNVFSGTVRDYILKFIEPSAVATTVTTSGKAAVKVPGSPTQGVSREAVISAVSTLHTGAATGFTKTQYSAAMARAWRTLGNNYDLMPTNLEARKAGNWDLTFTKEVVVFVCVLLFNGLTRDQQDGFRIMLADYTGARAGFSPNELSNKVEAAVGAAPNVFKQP